MTPETIIHVAQTVIVALFILGRWSERREGSERVTVAQLAEVKAAIDKVSDDKADGDRVSDLEVRLQRDHDDRRLRTEQVNAAMGKLDVAQAGYIERLKAVERDVGELRRRVFNGGHP